MKNDQYKAALEEVFTEIDALRLPVAAGSEG